MRHYLNNFMCGLSPNQKYSNTWCREIFQDFKLEIHGSVINSSRTGTGPRPAVFRPVDYNTLFLGGKNK